MTIEFLCTGCGQKLRVSDDSAGKKAKCPKCREILEIPLVEASLEELEPDADEFWESQFGETNASANANPYSAPQLTAPVTVGESPFQTGKIHNVIVDIGDILNYSWEVWSKNLGLLVGAFVVVAAITGGIETVKQGVLKVVGNNRDAAAIVVIVTSIAGNIVQVYLGIGLAQMTMGLARRRRVEFGDLFAGGSRMLPTIGVSILYGLAVAGGTMLCILPGIFVALMWWPTYYLVVDEKSSVMESFTLASEITQGNKGTTFIMWLAGGGIMMLGVMACCIGIIFAAPLVTTITSVAYLMMSGQIPTRPNVPAW